MYEERSRFSKTGVNIEQSAWSGFLKRSADKCASISTKEPFVVEVTPKYQQPQSRCSWRGNYQCFYWRQTKSTRGRGALSAFWEGPLGRIRCLHSALKMFFTLCSEKLRRYCRTLLAPILERFETAQS